VFFATFSNISAISWQPVLNVNINDVSSDVENAKYKNVVYFNKDCHKGQWVRQGESASHDSKTTTFLLAFGHSFNNFTESCENYLYIEGEKNICSM
jgi:hypothetical protein